MSTTTASGGRMYRAARPTLRTSPPDDATGAVTVNSYIELHLFTDAPEEVVLEIEERGLTYRDCQKRYRYNGNGVSIVPGYRFTLRGERIEALVFPEKGLRQAPLSPVDRRPMPRAGRNRVLALLEDGV